MQFVISFLLVLIIQVSTVRAEVIDICSNDETIIVVTSKSIDLNLTGYKQEYPLPPVLLAEGIATCCLQENNLMLLSRLGNLVKFSLKTRLFANFAKYQEIQLSTAIKALDDSTDSWFIVSENRQGLWLLKNKELINFLPTLANFSIQLSDIQIFKGKEELLVAFVVKYSCDSYLYIINVATGEIVANIILGKGEYILAPVLIHINQQLTSAYVASSTGSLQKVDLKTKRITTVARSYSSTKLSPLVFSQKGKEDFIWYNNLLDKNIGSHFILGDKYFQVDFRSGQLLSFSLLNSKLQSIRQLTTRQYFPKIIVQMDSKKQNYQLILVDKCGNLTTYVIALNNIFHLGRYRQSCN